MLMLANLLEKKCYVIVLNAILHENLLFSVYCQIIIQMFIRNGILTIEFKLIGTKNIIFKCIGHILLNSYKKINRLWDCDRKIVNKVIQEE